MYSLRSNTALKCPHCTSESGSVGSKMCAMRRAFGCAIGTKIAPRSIARASCGDARAAFERLVGHHDLHAEHLDVDLRRRFRELLVQEVMAIEDLGDHRREA